MTQIYLISPPRIDLKIFSTQLEKALKTSLVPVFQLRLKNYEKPEVKSPVKTGLLFVAKSLVYFNCCHRNVKARAVMWAACWLLAAPP